MPVVAKGGDHLIDLIKSENNWAEDLVKRGQKPSKYHDGGNNGDKYGEDKQRKDQQEQRWRIEQKERELRAKLTQATFELNFAKMELSSAEQSGDLNGIREARENVRQLGQVVNNYSRELSNLR